jgi:hypothetical protein
MKKLLPFFYILLIVVSWLLFKDKLPPNKGPRAGLENDIVIEQVMGPFKQRI